MKPPWQAVWLEKQDWADALLIILNPISLSRTIQIRHPISNSCNYKAQGIEPSSGMEQFKKSISSHFFALLSLKVTSFSGWLSPHSYQVYILAAQQPSLKNIFLSRLFHKRFLLAQLRSHVITEPITMDKAVCFDWSGQSHGSIPEPPAVLSLPPGLQGLRLCKGICQRKIKIRLAERQIDSAKLEEEEVSEASRGKNLRKHSFSGSYRVRWENELLLKFCALYSSLTPSPGPKRWASKIQNIHFTHIQKYLPECLKSPPLKILFFGLDRDISRSLLISTLKRQMANLLVKKSFPYTC